MLRSPIIKMRGLVQSGDGVDLSLCCETAQTLEEARNLLFKIAAFNKVIPVSSDLRSSRKSGDSQITGLTLLNRLTVVISNVAQIPILNQIEAARLGYEVIAVRPLNESVLKAICEKGQCDLISLDLTTQILSPGVKNSIKSAIGRGVGIEIELAPFLRDNSSRPIFISQCRQHLSSFGSGVFLSSGAKNLLELRSPSDLDNFGTAVFGLKSKSSKEATECFRRALKRNMTQAEPVDITMHSE